MADNAVLNAGSGGITLALDDIGGIHHQRVKVQYGADGSATDVSSITPLPITGVVDATGSVVTASAGTNLNTSLLALEAGGNLAGAATSLAIVDDWDETDRAKVNIVVGQAGITAGAGAVAANTPRVTHASDDPVVTALQIIDNMISGSEAQVDIVSIAAGATKIGDVGIGTRTSGGATTFRSLDIDETEEEVKASAGQVYWIHAMNLTASKRYLKLYDNVAASVTVGTTTPTHTFVMHTNGDTNGSGFFIQVPMGIPFSTGICVACTTGLADNDTGAPGVNDVIVHIGFA